MFCLTEGVHILSSFLIHSVLWWEVKSILGEQFWLFVGGSQCLLFVFSTLQILHCVLTSTVAVRKTVVSLIVSPLLVCSV